MKVCPKIGRLEDTAKIRFKEAEFNKNMRST